MENNIDNFFENSSTYHLAKCQFNEGRTVLKTFIDVILREINCE